MRGASVDRRADLHPYTSTVDPREWKAASDMSTFLRLLRAGFPAVGILVLLGIASLVISLMVPIKAWRTGELPVEPFRLHPAKSFASPPIRVWIDTDAACGQGQRTDPDDCLAILLLAQQNAVEVVGISTVFGNAPLVDTDRVTRNLINLLGNNRPHGIPVYRGASEPLKQGGLISTVAQQEAHEALRKALHKNTLVIVALGPLTNVAIALKDHPQLQANVTRLVAVMGRREGHVFHPVEGGTAHSFLGHGPIFRDFNFAKDEEAAALVAEMGLPMTLVPYEAARNVTVNSTVLAHLADRGGAAEWVAQQARPWLTYWREDIGRDGFYPFDLIAAAYVVQPSLLRCTDVPIVVKDDEWVFGWLGFRGIFAESRKDSASREVVSRAARYCPEVSEHLETWLFDQLTGGHAAGIS
jgi:purine nucleosidase